MPLPEWIPGVKRSRLHAEAWNPELTLNPDGRSIFSLATEAAILVQLSSHGVDVAERRLHVAQSATEPDVCVEMVLVDRPIRIWIYNDQIEILGPEHELRLEHWDADSPQAARAAATDLLERALSAVPSRSKGDQDT